jgi:hypothetical protein
MKVSVSGKVPEPYASQKGKTYETRYLYTGFGRYNEYEKTLEVVKFESESSTYSFFSRPYVEGVFSRVYHVESVTLTLYSASPRVWKETVGEDTFFFHEIVQEGPQPSF